MDITGRPSGRWIIDFAEMSEAEAALYEAPFQYVARRVKPVRANNRDRQRRETWWRLGRSGADLKAATEGNARAIITPRVAKYRLFVWCHPQLLPDSRLVLLARDDDTFFGVLHSRIHETWSLATGSRHGDGTEGGRPTYNNHACFETFPFPEGLTPDVPAEAYAGDPRARRIAAVATRLNELRESWLNPPDLVVRVPEVVPGYPERILPRDEECAKELKKRTLTNLYNQRPAWLDNVHRELDEAVAAAYGWPADLSDDEILQRLFELKKARAGATSAAAAE